MLNHLVIPSVTQGLVIGAYAKERRAPTGEVVVSCTPGGPEACRFDLCRNALKLREEAVDCLDDPSLILNELISS